MRHFRMYGVVATTITAIVLTSCGGGAPSAPSFQRSSDANSAGTIMKAPPTSAYYDSILANEFGQATAGGFTLTESVSPTVFLNFFGATVEQGYEQGQSFIVCSSSAEVPEAKYDGFERAQIEDAIKTYYSEAKIDIAFVNAAPASGSYTAVHIGGKYQDLGCRTGELLQGAAPFDIGNVNPSDTGFVFSDSISGIENVVAITLEIIGNTYGLRKGDSTISGVPTVSADSLTGVEEIHSMARLLWKVDPATIIDISPMQHELDVLVPGDIDLTGFDKIITATLGAAQSSAANDTGSGSSSGSGSALGDLFAGFGTILTGVDPNTVSAVATMAGHPEIAIAAQVLLPMVQDQTNPDQSNPTAAENNQSLVPDYASLLGLREITSMNALIANFWAHMDVINAEYSGTDRKALRSLLIVSYSQVYRDNVSFD